MQKVTCYTWQQMDRNYLTDLIVFDHNIRSHINTFTSGDTNVVSLASLSSFVGDTNVVPLASLSSFAGDREENL